MKKLLFLALLAVGFEAYAEEDAALEFIAEYLEFAEYSDGSISPEQLESINQSEIAFIDVRNAGQFTAGYIPGAKNIEWREILNRRDEIPTDKPVVLYCETGLLSSKAHLILRLAGYDNVKVLWGGYLMWSSRQSFDEAQHVGGTSKKN